MALGSRGARSSRLSRQMGCCARTDTDRYLDGSELRILWVLRIPSTENTEYWMRCDCRLSRRSIEIRVVFEIQLRLVLRLVVELLPSTLKIASFYTEKLKGGCDWATNLGFWFVERFSPSLILIGESAIQSSVFPIGSLVVNVLFVLWVNQAAFSKNFN